jgi:hypothetical protein
MRGWPKAFFFPGSGGCFGGGGGGASDRPSALAALRLWNFSLRWFFLIISANRDVAFRSVTLLSLTSRDETEEEEEDALFLPEAGDCSR